MDDIQIALTSCLVAPDRIDVPTLVAAAESAALILSIDEYALCEWLIVASYDSLHVPYQRFR